MIESTFRQLVEDLTTLKPSLNHSVEIVTVPYIVVHKVSAPRGYTLSGSDTTVVTRFQVDVYANDYPTAKTHCTALYGLQFSTGTDISSIQLENEIDMYESDTKLHHIALDFIVRHYEQIGD